MAPLNGRRQVDHEDIALLTNAISVQTMRTYNDPAAFKVPAPSERGIPIIALMKRRPPFKQSAHHIHEQIAGRLAWARATHLPTAPPHWGSRRAPGRGCFALSAVRRAVCCPRYSARDRLWRLRAWRLPPTSAAFSDCTCTTRAPAVVNASAIPMAISGSSSTMRIERPARLVLCIEHPRRGQARLPECRLVESGDCRRSILNTRDKRDDRLFGSRPCSDDSLAVALAH
jgi:hypothetical protein